MVEERNYCSDAIKKDFNKELVMTSKNNEDFKNSSECWICDNGYIDGDHCHILIFVLK